MRWQYLFDKEDPDFKIKEEKLKRIRNFWIAFEKICLPHWENRDNDKDALMKFAEWMQKQLSLIDEQLMWEAHATDTNCANLVITAENEYSKCSLARSVIEAAPEMQGWNFLSYRPALKPEDISDYCQNVARFEPPNDLRVSWSKNECNKIELTFYSNKFGILGIADHMEKCLLVTTYALGEEMFERWIDTVFPTKFTSAPAQFFNRILGKESTESYSLDLLQPECEKLRKSIIDSLPAQHFSEFVPREEIQETPHYTAGGLQGDEEHPGRKERIFYMMRSKSILNAVIDGMYFHSECHSKLKELFCYIKSIPFDRESERAKEMRHKFEVEIDSELRKADIGCTIGTGAGLTSIFVDLVLKDIERAVPILQSIVRKYALPEGTWLLFYDSHLCDEWVGLTPHAKSPF